MPFRRYEMRFTREDGRVLRGPVFTKGSYAKMQGVIDRLDDLSVLRMQMGRRRIVIPRQTLENGHAEIKPVGLLYAWIRTWRCR